VVLQVRWEREQVVDAEEAVELLLNCSAVVGMHPDQVGRHRDAVTERVRYLSESGCV
jgi:predicted metal-dependent TIM-barrel fold hydrolase